LPATEAVLGRRRIGALQLRVAVIWLLARIFRGYDLSGIGMAAEQDWARAQYRDGLDARRRTVGRHRRPVARPPVTGLGWQRRLIFLFACVTAAIAAVCVLLS
jgi:hypothetical protein